MNSTSIQQFQHEQFGTIRTTTIDDEPWFVAKDVCSALDLKNVTMALTRLDEDEFSSTEVIDSMGRTQNTKVVNEAGLYALVLSSRKPEAKAFKRWVTHEVLPEIRSTGGYMVAREDESEEDLLARALIVAQRTIDRVKQRNVELETENAKQSEQIETMQPKALFADAVTTSKTSILVGELAKILKQNGYDTGPNRFFETLRIDGYLIGGNRSDRNMPTQRSMDLGLFEVKERTVSNPDGTVRITKTPKVTGKGQVYFINHYCGNLIPT